VASPTERRATTDAAIFVGLPKSLKPKVDPAELIRTQLDTAPEQVKQVRYVTIIIGALVSATAATLLRVFVLNPWEKKKAAKG